MTVFPNYDIVPDIAYDELSKEQFEILKTLREEFVDGVENYLDLSTYDKGQVEMLATAGLIQRDLQEAKTIDNGDIKITINNSKKFKITTKGILLTNKRSNYERYFYFPLVISLASLAISILGLFLPHILNWLMS